MITFTVSKKSIKIKKMKNTKNQSIRSQVMTLAHSKSDCESFGQAQRKAWTTIRAKQLMSNAIVTITFLSSKGITTRLATRQDAFMPQLKGTTKSYNRTSNKVTFWSIGDNGFRAFLPHNLISIDKVENVSEFAYNLIAA